MWSRFIRERFWQTVPVLLGVSLIVFLTMHLTPGDPVEHMLGQAGRVTRAEINDLRAHYALDKPFALQYGLFVGNALRGDFGPSYSHHGRPVIEVIADRLPATLELTFCSFVLALVLAIPAGVLASLRPQGLFDRLGTVIALLGISMPGFWLGIVLMIIFGLRLQWLPISGRVDLALAPAPITGMNSLDALLTADGAALWSASKYLFLPAITMAAPMAAMVMRMVRSSMIGVLEQDYIQFARSKGLPEGSVVGKHALKNALIPTVNIVAIQTGLLLSGNMIIETVFQYPGIGKLAVDAIASADYPLVQAVVLIYSVSYVLLTLLADAFQAILDPRIRKAQGWNG